MLRRLAVLIGLLASAALLGGCVAYENVVPAQDEVGGPVRVQLTICATDQVTPIDHAGCAYGTNRPADAANDEYQVLLAFRLPAGSSAPESFASTAGEPLTFSRSPSYEQELSRVAPAPAGQVWAGYLSSPYTLAYAGMEAARESTVAPSFTLPRPAEGGPFQAPFGYLPVVGGREIGDANEPAASDPVSCGDGIDGDPTACIDYPLESQLASNFNFFGTRDFGIVAGNATASAGQTVALPFNVRGAGALPAGLTAGLTATTALPGATVAPSVPSAPLSNGSDTRVTVPVAIPAGAAAGTYEVALIGRLENGQERRGVAQLTVRARPEAPNVAPVVSGLLVKPKTFKPATRRKPKRGTDVSYTLSEAASVRVSVERCSKYAKPKRKARAKRSLADVAARKGRRKPAARRGRCLSFKALSGTQTKAGKAGANGFRFNGKVNGKALKPGAYRLALTPADAAGARGATVRAAFAIAR